MLPAASDAEQAKGAYGLELAGLAAWDLLVPLERGLWPLVQISHEKATGRTNVNTFGDERATVSLGPGEQARLDRSKRHVTFVTAGGPDDGRLTHPFLGSVGAVFAWWQGNLVFHGGAVVAGGGAWALLGSRGTGKSSLLASLATAGCQVLTDDVLVIAENLALAGPRCIDLREEAVGPLGLEGHTLLVREGERQRLELGPVAPEVPLRGWILLSWGSHVELRELGVAERLEGLAANVQGLHHDRFLPLARLPAWQLVRPPDWRSVQIGVEVLLDIWGI
jgi:hypothetical protein